MGRLFMNSPDGQQLIRHVKDAVFEIATLTSVDGATVLDFSFDVLAFGVKITPIDPDKAPHEITRHSPFRGEESTTVRLADLGGTRHQSAAQFVYDQHEAVAIVVSQDGNVSLFYWGYGENRVQVIQNLEVILDY